MFKALREKLTGWFKKDPAEQPKKEEKPKEIIKEKPKKEKKKPEKQTKVKKEKLSQIQEIKEQPLKEIEKEKQGFFKKLFSKKKKVHVTPEKQLSIESEQAIHLQSIELEKPFQQPEQPLSETAISREEKPKEGFFTKLKKHLSTSTLTQQQFDELFQELEITLLENNVALEVVDKIRESLTKDLVGIEVKKSEVNQTIISSLKEAINSILIEPPNLIQLINKSLESPFTIIFVGINGSGKTTTIAKIAHLLKQNKISCCLAAADTFRAASIEQLKEHASGLNIPIIAHQYGSDPAAVAFDAKRYAKAHNIKVVLIDTAGRMYTKTNLIKEMEKIVRISQPNLKIFVGESITGNDATEQARTFNEAINIDGIVLTKADVDEKAGAILSVSQVTKKPIYFLGTGQRYQDLTLFTKKEVLKNLAL